MMLSLFRNETVRTGVNPMTPIGDAGYVVMDTELTGLEIREDSVVSLGGLKMKGSRIGMSSAYYEIVSPRTSLKSDSVIVHGITPSEVKEKPTIDKVLGDFLTFCEGSVIVGHFIALDVKFLNRELRRFGFRPLANAVVDTCAVYDWIKHHGDNFSRSYMGRMESRDLFSIAKQYHIPVSGAHNALQDAFITAQVFQRFLSMLPGLGVKTLKDLLKIGRP
jgi:DNA polymerase-3 subunit epsilon